MQTLAEFTLRFLICYFVDMLFFDPISVNPLFVYDGVKKITTALFFASPYTRRLKLLTLCSKTYIVQV